ncbi:hypothetical protein LPJ66_011698, partial [Kickxella alabastrina]
MSTPSDKHNSPVPSTLLGEVRSGHELDIQKLEMFLKQSKQDVLPPLSVKQFNVGQSNPTYLITDSAGKNY